VRRAVDPVGRVVGAKRPAEEKIKEALDVVKKPDEPKKGKTSRPRYYGPLPELGLEVRGAAEAGLLGGAHEKAKEHSTR